MSIDVLQIPPRSEAEADELGRALVRIAEAMRCPVEHIKQLQDDEIQFLWIMLRLEFLNTYMRSEPEAVDRVRRGGNLFDEH